MFILPENTGPHCDYKIIGRGGAAGNAPAFSEAAVCKFSSK